VSECQDVLVWILVAVCGLAAVAWAYLLIGHGGYWRTDQRLPPADRPGPSAGPAAPAGLAGLADPADPVGPADWPSVAAVVPARDEASILPQTLPALLAQDYPGRLTVLVVDDESSDGTAEVAARLGERAVPAGQPGESGQPGGSGGSGRSLRVVPGRPAPAGWAGKVWAMEQGRSAAADVDYLLFTDADIACAPATLTALVRAAQAGRRVLVSQMALLRADTFWERLLVPAFVYFFAQLYPFRRVNTDRSATAAAAGGCMLVRADALAAAGSLAAIRDARIDDVALGRLLKRGHGGGCWLGLSTGVVSRRQYEGLAPVWDMVARSAYTQLRYSPLAVAGTVIGLTWLYLLPPVAGLGGLAATAAGAGAAAAWLAVAGLAGWGLMSVSYLPMLRLYRLSPLRAPALPLIAAMYAAMTGDSARRHHLGRGGEWKGRTIPPAARPPRTGR
jgi:hopene-associated glycosyltransferase HpnB